MAKPSPFLHLTANRVYLALDDLLVKRVTHLRSFRFGVYIEPELIDVRDRIAALPEVVKGRPLADALAAADEDHDSFGAASWHLVEAYLLAPGTTPEQRDAALQIRRVLGTLDDLQAKYDTEAKAAVDKRAQMTSLLPLLQLFPLAGNKTLADWAEPHVAAGETLGTLLSQRADAKDRAAAGRLRSAGIGLLNRLRDELARARKVDVSLAATLDQDLFAYADLLEVASATEAAEAKKAAEVQKAEEMTRKAEGKARRADDKTKRAAEAGRHARDAARRAEEAQKEAEAAAKAAAEAEQEAQAERDAKAKKGGGSDG